MSTFGSSVKKIRKTRGWTQAKLGEQLGVAESTVSLYEAGKREPDIATINRIADLFLVSTDCLLGRTEYQDFIVQHIGRLLEDLPPEALKRVEEYIELLRLKYDSELVPKGIAVSKTELSSPDSVP